MASLGRVWQSRAVFCGLLALAMVGARVAVFDARFLSGQSLPNHDMSQGIAFFATNMHSVRLSGDIAWWNPLTNNGYAQHYQSFFSPLAPTAHHIVFILWAQLIRGLSLLGMAVAEYYQYLIVNYLILPFLTFFAFSLFASFLFRRRGTVLLVTLVYTFSAIGLWNSAWFYFQESSSLFFLLAGWIAALRRPSRQRLCLLTAAILIQVTSVNYWTVHNFFFVAILLASYCFIYPHRVRRLFRVMRVRARRCAPGTLFTSVLVGTVLVTWGTMLYSVLAEQRHTFYRRAEGSSFSIAEAYESRPVMRSLTADLFNPAIADTSEPSPMHQARYIGCALLPLLLVAFMGRWRRQQRWLLASAAGVFLVCLAPPFLVALWKALPMMDQARHIFRFYSHHWQLMLVLLAGSAFDTLLERNYLAATRRRFQVVTIGLAAVLLGLLMIKASHPALPLYATSLFLGMVAAVLVAKMVVLSDRVRRASCAGLLLLLTACDLTKYFSEMSSLDAQFTVSRFGYPDPLPGEMRNRLLQPWSRPDLSRGFDAALLDNLPITNAFWPRNDYLASWYAMEAKVLQEIAGANQIVESEPLDFYTSTADVENPQRALALFATDSKPLRNKEVLLLQRRPQATNYAGLAPHPQGSLAACREEAGQSTLCESRPPKLSYEMRHWSYNGAGFDVSAPKRGWLFIRQLYDPRWKMTLDGGPVRPVRANFGGMAIRIKEGRHALEMDYRPTARQIYWWACLLLEVTLLMLAIPMRQRHEDALGYRSSRAQGTISG